MPETHGLLTSQKNEVFECIEAADLEPANFSWTKEKGSWGIVVPRLNYLDGEYFFRFDLTDSGSHYCYFSPGEETLSETHHPGPWSSQMDYFNGWLTCLVRETQSPDLWQLIQNQKPLITGATLEESEITFFTDEEKQHLKMSVKEFRLLVESNFGPSTEQMETIDSRLDYLSKAVDRLNRFDWKSLAITTVLNITVALTLDAEKGRTLWSLFQKVFSGALHLLH